MQHAATAAAWNQQQHWFTVRAARCEITWRKERHGVLRVQLRLASQQRALFLGVFFGILVLTATIVAILAYLHVDHSFLIMALSPFAIFFLLLVAFKSTSSLALAQNIGINQ